jgi:hypothetical protein
MCDFLIGHLDSTAYEAIDLAAPKTTDELKFEELVGVGMKHFHPKVTQWVALLTTFMLNLNCADAETFLAVQEEMTLENAVRHAGVYLTVKNDVGGAYLGNSKRETIHQSTSTSSPNPHGARPKKKCWRCNRSGHKSHQCDGILKNIICTKCKEPGHFAYVCDAVKTYRAAHQRRPRNDADQSTHQTPSSATTPPSAGNSMAQINSVSHQQQHIDLQIATCYLCEIPGRAM